MTSVWNPWTEPKGRVLRQADYRAGVRAKRVHADGDARSRAVPRDGNRSRAVHVDRANAWRPFTSESGPRPATAIGRRTFDTLAAADAGRRTRRELLTSTTRNAHGT